MIVKKNDEHFFVVSTISTILMGGRTDNVDQCSFGSGSMVINHGGRQTGKNTDTNLKNNSTSLIKSHPSKIDSKELSKSECSRVFQNQYIGSILGWAYIKGFLSLVMGL